MAVSRPTATLAALLEPLSVPDAPDRRAPQLRPDPPASASSVTSAGAGHVAGDSDRRRPARQLAPGWPGAARPAQRSSGEIGRRPPAPRGEVSPQPDGSHTSAPQAGNPAGRLERVPARSAAANGRPLPLPFAAARR
ncbi:MAG TPA: hypothetical protein VFS21_31025 [Roseiflexaceae bacterium]|nr:hypothetical protein [Roseiflexaceae bacterium]